jgi:hypothetical protein
MNQTEMWHAVAPTPAEINAALDAFDYEQTGSSDVIARLPSDVIARLPQLVMIRRAVAAGFFNEDVA